MEPIRSEGFFVIAEPGFAGEFFRYQQDAEQHAQKLAGDGRPAIVFPAVRFAANATSPPSTGTQASTGTQGFRQSGD
jgi:hypothetical protein